VPVSVSVSVSASVSVSVSVSAVNASVFVCVCVCLCVRACGVCVYLCEFFVFCHKPPLTPSVDAGYRDQEYLM